MIIFNWKFQLEIGHIWHTTLLRITLLEMAFRNDLCKLPMPTDIDEREISHRGRPRKSSKQNETDLEASLENLKSVASCLKKKNSRKPSISLR